MQSPARQKPAGREVGWIGNTSLETDKEVLLMSWEGKGGMIGLKVGIFQGEVSAKGLRPGGRGYPWVSLQRFLGKQALAYLGS